MRRNLLVAAVFSCGMFFLGTAWQTRGTEPEGAASHPTSVAILDMAKVYEAHPSFKRASEELAADLKAVENIRAEKRKQAEDTQRSLNAAEGDAAKNAATAELEKQKAELTKFVNEQRQAFTEREAHNYADAYRDIMEEVSKLARARGIGLVMRFSHQTRDMTTVAGVQAELNKAVLYHDGIDITDDVIRIVKAKNSPVVTGRSLAD